MAPIDSKDPVLAEAGKRGALKRWGPPKNARLDDFTPEERAVIHALIEAEREAKHRREAAAGSPDRAA